MEESDLTRELALAKKAARAAGVILRGHYKREGLKVGSKGHDNPVTQADLEADSAIKKALRDPFPSYGWLSEETVDNEDRLKCRRVWIVDPLDGTKEFLRRNGEFTVNIALVEGDLPILGVVYAPVIGKMYFAARGTGAYKDDGEAIQRLNATRPPNATLRTVVSRSHPPQQENLECLSRSVQNCEFIAMGSSLKFCLVAEGAADIYPRTGATMEWDTAAAHCILVEAGGVITDLDGNAVYYNKPELLNPGFLAKGASRATSDLIGSIIGELLQAEPPAPFRP